MNRGVPAEGEWYHCYNRGVDKRRIFSNSKDYERFQMLLYITNSDERLHLSDFGQSGQGPTLPEVFAVERGNPLVGIAAYALMPNHFHLLLKPAVPKGLSLFMQKITTGYSMYFNKKYERSGTLLEGKFKSKHVDSDEYFRRVFNYIHANAAELYEPSWKEGRVHDNRVLQKKLFAYPYASLGAYAGAGASSPLLDQASVYELFERMPTFDDLLAEAQSFAKMS